MNLLNEIIYRFLGEYTTERLVKMGLKVGRNFGRLNGVILDPSHCWFITIGDNVTLASRVHILAHDASTKFYLNYTHIGRVNIDNNVFIDANSTVTKDIPSNCVYAGNPARFICTTEDYINKNLMEHNILYNEEYTLRKNISKDKKVKMYRLLKDNIGFVD